MYGNNKLFQRMSIVLLITFICSFVLPMNFVQAAINKPSVQSSNISSKVITDTNKKFNAQSNIKASTKLGTYQEQLINQLKAIEDSENKKDIESVKTLSTAMDKYVQQGYTEVINEFSNNEKILNSISAKNALQKQKKYSSDFEKSYQQILEKAKSLDSVANSNKFDEKKIDSELSSFEKLLVHNQKSKALGDTLPHSETVPKQDVVTKDINSLMPASTSSLSVDDKALVSTVEDLAQNRETILTPDIKSISDTLKNDALSLYEYVRNNMAFETYNGSRKGAVGTLQQKAGNDVDQASLLITLLRSKNIPSKYVTGTIEVPIDKAMSWTGAETPEAAAKMLAGMDNEVTSCVSGGKIVAIRMEHTWVEAYVSVESYRGIGPGMGEMIWIPLDPSFKLQDKKKGIDINSIPGVNTTPSSEYVNTEESIINKLGGISRINVSDLQGKLGDTQTKIQEYIKTKGITKITDILGGLEIIPENLGLLPLSLPYKTVEVKNRFSKTDDSITDFISFSINGESVDPDNINGDVGFNLRLSANELYGKKITLSYIPATDEDQNIINKYGDIFKTPAYLVKVKPVLKINGETKETGNEVGLGYYENFSMIINEIGQNPQKIDNPVIAGGYYCVGFDYSKIAPEELKVAQTNATKIQASINQNNIYNEDVIGEVLNATIKTYFGELDTFNYINAEKGNVRATRQISEGMTGCRIDVSYMFNIPAEISNAGLYIDIDYDAVSVVSSVSDKNAERNYMVSSGMMGSAMENGIFEQLYGMPSVSTIKILGEANKAGIPIYTIDKNNIATVLTNLQISDSVKTDITNSVNAGKVVTIPEKEIRYFNWVGSGYIVMDPTTGAAGYMISGGTAGGSSAVVLTADDWKMILTDFVTGLAEGLVIMLAAAVIFGPAAVIAALPIIAEIMEIFMLMQELQIAMEWGSGEISNKQAVIGYIEILTNLISLDGFLKMPEIFGKAKNILGELEIMKSFYSKLDGLHLPESIGDRLAETFGMDKLPEAEGVVNDLKEKSVPDDVINDAVNNLDDKGLKDYEGIVDKLSEDGIKDPEKYKDALERYENGENASDIILREEGGCFTGETLIYTKDGLKAINQVKDGDEVYSKNAENGDKGYKKVLQTSIRNVSTLVLIYLGSEIIKTTENHPFWVVGKGWVPAGNLTSECKLNIASGETLEIDKVEIEKLGNPVKVYNLIVAEWHTYFVADKEILVHNGSCPPVDGVPKETQDAVSKLGLKEGPEYELLKGYKEGKYSIENVNGEMKTEFELDSRAINKIEKIGGTTVFVDANGKPVQLRWEVTDGGVRGTDYLDVNVPDGMEKGHIKCVQEGAIDDAIDDGPLDIIAQTFDVNRSNIRRFENYRSSSCNGMEVITDILPAGNVRVRVPNADIDVTYDPTSTVRWVDGWFLRKDVKIWDNSSPIK